MAVPAQGGAGYAAARFNRLLLKPGHRQQGETPGNRVSGSMGFRHCEFDLAVRAFPKLKADTAEISQKAPR